MPETEIKTALISLLTSIKAADSQTIAMEISRVESLLERHRDQLHPQLVHFLQNRSYAKAEMFLSGESGIPVGVCGGRVGRN